MSYKYNYRESIIKNIPIFVLIFLLLSLVFFSGCVSFCGFDSEDDCVSYTDAQKLCKELSDSINNYPICSTYGKSVDSKDCHKIFNTNIINSLEFANLSIESKTLLNNYRYNLIESWKYSDKIVFDIYNINNICDSFFDKDYLEYRNSILENTRSFDYYNNELMLSFILSLYSVKKDLLDMNVLLMQDTLLYEKYIELNNIINEFIKSTGKDVDVKESLSKDQIDFYFKYYASEESKEELQNSLLELNKDITTESNIFGFSTSAITLGSLIFITGSISPIGGLISSFSLANSMSNIISEYYSIAILKSSLSEWENLKYFRELLINFEKSNGKNSYSSKAYFNLIKQIDLELSNINTSVIKRTKDLDTKILKLEQELNSKLINKDEFSLLYKKYGLIQAPNELYSTIENIKLELNSFTKLSLGEKYSKLNILENKTKELESSILVFEDSELTSIVTLCTADLTLEKQSFESLDNSNKILLENYLNLFFKTSNDRDKLLYCNSYFELKDTYSESCTYYLKNLASTLNYTITTDECITQLNSLIFKLTNSELYSDLDSELKSLENIYLAYEKLYKYSSCIPYDKYYKNSLKYNSYLVQTKYSENKAVNIILRNLNYLSVLEELTLFKTELKKDLSNNLSCYFNEICELNNSELDLYSYLGNFDLVYEVIFENLKFSNVSNECVINFDIDSQKIKFNCLKDILKLNVSQEFLQSVKNKTISYDLNKLNIVQEVCLLNSKSYIDLDLYFDKEKILFHSVSLNGLILGSNLDDKLRVYFNSITNKKVCLDISYILDSPIDLEYNLDSISGNNLKYSIDVKNNLNLELNDLEVYIPNVNEVSLDKISFSNNLDYGTKADKIFFKVNLLPFESKFLSMIIEKDSLEFTSEIKNLEEDILSLEKIPWISQTKILELKKSLESLKTSKDSLTLAKSIVSLKAKIDSLLSESINNSLYELQRKDKINILLKYEEQFNSAKNILLNDYNISLSSLPSFADINYIINQSNELFELGKIKESLKILDNFDFKNKEIEEIISNLYDFKVKEFNDLKKLFREYSLSLDETNISKIGNLFSSSLKNYNYSVALNYINEYNQELSNLNAILNNEEVLLKANQNNLILDYKNYKTSLDLLWNRVLFLDNQINSSRFAILEDLKIELNFTKKDLESIKTNISKLTKQTLNLDLLIKEDNVSEKTFLEFFYDFDILEKNIKTIEVELQDTAKDKLIYAKANLKNERDYLQARDYYDLNSYVDSIYFSGLAILGSSNKDYSLYIGIGFIILLAFLVYFFGKKYTPKKEVSKETYYSLEKED